MREIFNKMRFLYFFAQVLSSSTYSVKHAKILVFGDFNADFGLFGWMYIEC